jgi:hypothetical protein
MVTSIQKDFDVWAARAGCFAESAFAPVLKSMQRCLDMLAGAQAVNAVIGTVAAIDWLRKRANLNTIGLSCIGVDPINAEKNIFRRLGFDPDWFVDATQAAAFDFIGVTGKPAGWQGPSLRL